jgi:hypothetical protein
MFINSRLDLFLLLPLLCAPQGSARQNNSATPSGQAKIYLDIVVTPKSGPPLRGLQQKDFTILDDEVPQTITSFEAFEGRQAPVEVLLLIDAVNIGSRDVAAQLAGIAKFLKAAGGRLAHPTAVAFLTDQEFSFQSNSHKTGTPLVRNWISAPRPSAISLNGRALMRRPHASKFRAGGNRDSKRQSSTKL